MTRTKRQKMLRAKVVRNKKPRPGCPTPWKRSYTQADLISTALRRSRNTASPSKHYLCKCGAHHFTTQ